MFMGFSWKPGFGTKTKDHGRANCRQALGVHLPDEPVVFVSVLFRQTKQLISEGGDGDDVAALFAQIFFGIGTVIDQMRTGE